FIAEADWPPAHACAETLHLTEGSLVPWAPEGTAREKSELVYRPDVGIAAGRYAIGQMLPGWGMGDGQRPHEGLSLVFTGDVLGDEPPIELIGAPVAHLWLSSTAEVAFVSVKLCELAPDGTSALVTKGILNLTHRDAQKRPESPTPGEIHAVGVPLQAIAYR